MTLTQNSGWETIKTIVIAVLLAAVFRSFLYEPFHIPSGSMKSTLLIGDYIFVSKPSYGYSRYSFPFGLPFFDGRVMDSDKPERGDIVVFRKPTDPSIDFIKRIIGLPGDTVQVKEGVVYLNGEALPQKPAGEFNEYDEERRTRVNLTRLIETLPGGKEHYILNETDFGPVDNTSVYHVPPGHYFMMGDNRDNSTDSRYLNEVGYVPEENLVGRAEIIVFSVGEGWSLRADRFLTLL